jgi:hypothetical protein
MSLGPYASFIVWSYLLVALVVLIRSAGSRSTIASSARGCANSKRAA